MTDRDARIEAAHRAAKAKYLRWHPEMKDSPGVTEHVLDEILEVALAAADAAVPCAAWWGEWECRVDDPPSRCLNEYDRDSRRGSVSFSHGVCGRRLVFAPCDTCDGEHEGYGGFDRQSSHATGEYQEFDCPDCGDGTQRRRVEDALDRTSIDERWEVAHGAMPVTPDFDSWLARWLENSEFRRWLLEQMGGERMSAGKGEYAYFVKLAEKETDR